MPHTLRIYPRSSFPERNEFGGKINPHGLRVFVEFGIVGGVGDIPGPVKTFAGSRHKDGRRNQPGVDCGNESSRRLDPRTDHLVAIRLVPSPSWVEDVLACKINDGMAGRKTFGVQCIPGDAIASAFARDPGHAITARTQRLG